MRKGRVIITSAILVLSTAGSTLAIAAPVMQASSSNVVASASPSTVYHT
jgi:hypothetical protein